MDIPETVSDASGVASQVASLLNDVKYTQAKEKVFDIPEKIVKADDDARNFVRSSHHFCRVVALL